MEKKLNIVIILLIALIAEIAVLTLVPIGSGLKSKAFLEDAAQDDFGGTGVVVTPRCPDGQIWSTDFDRCINNVIRDPRKAN